MLLKTALKRSSQLALVALSSHAEAAVTGQSHTQECQRAT